MDGAFLIAETSKGVESVKRSRPRQTAGNLWGFNVNSPRHHVGIAPGSSEIGSKPPGLPSYMREFVRYGTPCLLVFIPVCVREAGVGGGRGVALTCALRAPAIYMP